MEPQLVFPFALEAEHELVDFIRTRAQQHVALVTVAAELGISRDRAIEIARDNGIKYKHQRPPNSAIASAVDAVVRDGLTIRAAARSVGISRSAVNRYVVRRRQSAANKVAGIEFSRQQSHCRIHGRVNFWPCVACAAIDAKAKVPQ